MPFHADEQEIQILFYNLLIYRLYIHLIPYEKFALYTILIREITE